MDESGSRQHLTQDHQHRKTNQKKKGNAGRKAAATGAPSELSEALVHDSEMSDAPIDGEGSGGLDDARTRRRATASKAARAPVRKATTAMGSDGQSPARKPRKTKAGEVRETPQEKYDKATKGEKGMLSAYGICVVGMTSQRYNNGYHMVAGHMGCDDNHKEQLQQICVDAAPIVNEMKEEQKKLCGTAEIETVDKNNLTAFKIMRNLYSTRGQLIYFTVEEIFGDQPIDQLYPNITDKKDDVPRIKALQLSYLRTALRIIDYFNEQPQIDKYRREIFCGTPMPPGDEYEGFPLAPGKPYLNEDVYRALVLISTVQKKQMEYFNTHHEPGIAPKSKVQQVCVPKYWPPNLKERNDADQAARAKQAYAAYMGRVLKQAGIRQDMEDAKNMDDADEAMKRAEGLLNHSVDMLDPATDAWVDDAFRDKVVADLLADLESLVIFDDRRRMNKIGLPDLDGGDDDAPASVEPAPVEWIQETIHDSGREAESRALDGRPDPTAAELREKKVRSNFQHLQRMMNARGAAKGRSFWNAMREINADIKTCEPTAETEHLPFTISFRGLPLKSWQPQAIAFIHQRNLSYMKGCILADDVGLGKTVESMCAMVLMSEHIEKLRKDWKARELELQTGHPAYNDLLQQFPAAWQAKLDADKASAKAQRLADKRAALAERALMQATDGDVVMQDAEDDVGEPDEAGEDGAAWPTMPEDPSWDDLSACLGCAAVEPVRDELRSLVTAERGEIPKHKPVLVANPHTAVNSWLNDTSTYFKVNAGHPGSERNINMFMWSAMGRGAAHRKSHWGAIRNTVAGLNDWAATLDSDDPQTSRTVVNVLFQSFQIKVLKQDGANVTKKQKPAPLPDDDGTAGPGADGLEEADEQDAPVDEEFDMFSPDVDQATTNALYPEVRKRMFSGIYIDEAHRMKNPSTLQTDALFLMEPEYNVLITGTPMKNTVSDFYGLLRFLWKGIWRTRHKTLQPLLPDPSKMGDLEADKWQKKWQILDKTYKNQMTAIPEAEIDSFLVLLHPLSYKAVLRSPTGTVKLAVVDQVVPLVGTLCMIRRLKGDTITIRSNPVMDATKEITIANGIPHWECTEVELRMDVFNAGLYLTGRDKIDALLATKKVVKGLQPSEEEVDDEYLQTDPYIRAVRHLSNHPLLYSFMTAKPRHGAESIKAIQSGKVPAFVYFYLWTTHNYWMGSPVIRSDQLQYVVGGSTRHKYLMYLLRRYIFNTADEKMIIWAHEPLTMLLVELLLKILGIKFVSIRAGITMQARYDNEQSYNTDPNVRVCVMSSRSAAESANLQAGGRIMVVMDPVSKNQLIQMIGRMNRIGQKRLQLVYVLTLDGTADTALTARYAERYQQQIVATSAVPENLAKQYMGMLNESEMKELQKKATACSRSVLEEAALNCLEVYASVITRATFGQRTDKSAAEWMDVKDHDKKNLLPEEVIYRIALGSPHADEVMLQFKEARDAEDSAMQSAKKGPKVSPEERDGYEFHSFAAVGAATPGGGRMRALAPTISNKNETTALLVDMAHKLSEKMVYRIYKKTPIEILCEIRDSIPPGYKGRTAYIDHAIDWLSDENQKATRGSAPSTPSSEVTPTPSARHGSRKRKRELSDERGSDSDKRKRELPDERGSDSDIESGEANKTSRDETPAEAAGPEAATSAPADADTGADVSTQAGDLAPLQDRVPKLRLKLSSRLPPDALSVPQGQQTGTSDTLAVHPSTPTASRPAGTDDWTVPVLSPASNVTYMTEGAVAAKWPKYSSPQTKLDAVRHLFTNAALRAATEALGSTYRTSPSRGTLDADLDHHTKELKAQYDKGEMDEIDRANKRLDALWDATPPVSLRMTGNPKKAGSIGLNIAPLTPDEFKALPLW